ncbi:hypothetical protein K490DRAFT_67730 [Saccharata proteae CBS 121410]|uniref:Cytochrome B pre-mRNA-processing protein 6 n=1 Tax=Saccharata proteae CBS 121410 TaxID=1314787 RepID=A0A9P4HTG5_9PEZI|nr:hypothetical protein K490DRAFT_67730 [Saccharata proteae CBS 121410]
MASANVSKHYARLAQLWPKDPLRPTVSFPAALKARSLAAVSEAEELRNINALYSLLDNRYTKAYPVSPNLLKPTSNPTYYEDLMVELSKAPERGWFERYVNKWKGFLRFS